MVQMDYCIYEQLNDRTGDIVVYIDQNQIAGSGKLTIDVTPYAISYPTYECDGKFFDTVKQYQDYKSEVLSKMKIESLAKNNIFSGKKKYHSLHSSVQPATKLSRRQIQYQKRKKRLHKMYKEFK